MDPRSVGLGAFETTLQPPNFFVEGDTPYVRATYGVRGWATIDLSTGLEVDRDLGHDWLIFGRWALVSGPEDMEEIVAEFEAEKSPTA